MPRTAVASFDFAYDAHYFRRSDGTNDLCFDRAKAHAQKSVWQYGTYNANDGSRVDLCAPGISYRCLVFPATPTTDLPITGHQFSGTRPQRHRRCSANLRIDRRRPTPRNTTSYQVSKVGGKLTKWTQQATTLDSLSNIPITFGGDLTGLTTGNGTVTGFQNWQLQWSSSAQNFTVIGTQQCGNNGCVVSALSPVATVNADAFDHTPISGWADSYGGSVNIPPIGVPHTPADAVYYYVQSTVIRVRRR